VRRIRFAPVYGVPVSSGGREALWRLPGMPGLLVVTLCGFTSYAVEVTTAPLWATRGGADTQQAGLVTGLLMLATVAAQLTVPRQIGRLGLHGAMAAGLVLLGGGSLVYLVSDSLAPVLAVSALRGLGFATLTVGCSAALARIAPAHRLGEAAGLYGLAVALPNVLGLPAGVWLAEHAGFAVVFAIGAAPLLAIPAALTSLRGIAGPDTAADASADVRADVRAGGYDRALVRLLAGPCAALFVATIAGGTLMTFLPLTPRLGGLVTLTLLVFGVTGTLGRWRVGVLVDRVGPDRLAPPFLATAVVGMLCVAAAATWPAAAWLAVLGGLVGGIGYGALQNSTLVAAMSRARATSSRRPARCGTAPSTWAPGSAVSPPGRSSARPRSAPATPPPRC
jgi:predicted MFS family arabinose efflux permease